MQEKSVTKSMSDEVVLSIEDIKEQASRKLPVTARGIILVFVPSRCQPQEPHSDFLCRILQLWLHLSDYSPREHHRLPEIPSQTPRSR